MAYAVQLIDPDAPPFIHVLRRIAHEHVSLGIRPEQYTIAGHHLLSAVEEVLGDAVTPEIARAWDEVYWLIATQLVAEEARPSISPGQYVSVFVDLPDGERQPRQYTVRRREAALGCRSRS